MTSPDNILGSVTSSKSRSSKNKSTCEFSKKSLEPFFSFQRYTDLLLGKEKRPAVEKIRTGKLDRSKFFSKISFHSILEKRFLISNILLKSYPNTPLKSTCAYIEFDNFKVKIDNEGL